MKGRLPKTSAKSVAKMALERAAFMIPALVTVGDTAQEARRRLIQTGRAQPGSGLDLMLLIQAHTCAQLSYLMKIDTNELDAIRATRDKEKFDREVERLMNRLAPIIIIPGR